MAAVIQIKTEAGTLDLLEGAETEFYVTRQIADLNNFGTRKSDYSKSLKIPSTPNNQKILNIADTTANTVQTAAEKIPCSIFMNGIAIAPTAWLLVSDITQTKNNSTITITILYGNFNFFDAIKGYFIADINWADLTLEWDLASTVPLSETLYTDNDIIVPACDWFTRDSGEMPHFGQTMDLNLSGFFIYARTIFERAISEAGFTLIVDSEVPAEFNGIAIACPITKFIDPQDSIETSPIQGEVTNNTNQLHAQGVDAVAIFQIEVKVSGIWDIAQNAYVIGVTQDYSLVVNGTFSNDKAHPQATDSSIGLYRNDILLQLFNIPNNETNTAFNLSTTFTGAASDIIQVKLHAGDRNGSFNDLTLNSSTIFGISTLGTDSSRTINIKDWIPEMAIEAFIVNIIQLYNLLLVTDEVKKTVTLSSFDSIYTNNTNDLSTLLSVGQEINTQLYIGSIGKNSTFSWLSDNLLRNDTIATVVFGGSLLEKNVSSIEMDFSSCDLSALNISGSSDAAKVPMVKTDVTTLRPSITLNITVNAAGAFTLDADYDFKVGDFLNIKNINPAFSYRVIQKTDGQTGVLQTPIDADHIGTSILDTKYELSESDLVVRLAIVGNPGPAINVFFAEGSYAGRVGLGPNALTADWPSSLIMSQVVAGQYKRVLDALKTPQVIKAKFNLTAIQVLTADLTQPVYVSQFNAYYFINKIDKFKIDTLTTLELVRISRIV